MQQKIREYDGREDHKVRCNRIASGRFDLFYILLRTRTARDKMNEIHFRERNGRVDREVSQVFTCSWVLLSLVMCVPGGNVTSATVAPARVSGAGGRPTESNAAERARANQTAHCRLHRGKDTRTAEEGARCVWCVAWRWSSLRVESNLTVSRISLSPVPSVCSTRPTPLHSPPPSPLSTCSAWDPRSR